MRHRDSDREVWWLNLGRSSSGRRQLLSLHARGFAHAVELRCLTEHTSKRCCADAVVACQPNCSAADRLVAPAATPHRPRTLDDVAGAVRLHQHIQANGEGHSWNQPFFCASTTTDHAATAPAAADATAPTAAGRKLLQPRAADPPTHTNSSNSSSSRPHSANIAMTTLRPLNITVDESDPSVWVDAGVKVIDLLQFLANYVTPAAPSGYTLGAFPWFVYQASARGQLSAREGAASTCAGWQSAGVRQSTTHLQHNRCCQH